MSSLAGTRRSIVKPVVLGIGAILLLIALLIGAWALWIMLRPAPAGFAPTSGQALTVVGQPPDVVQYTIDARSRKEWVYFSFVHGTNVSTSQDALDWDLAFRRTDVLTNGGDTNPQGQAGAVDLERAPLNEAAAPSGGFLQDMTHEDRGLENPALHNWYNYDWTSHIITSKNHTYALRISTGEVVLLTFVSYYCDDGSPGCITFRYRHIQDPDRTYSSGSRPLDSLVPQARPEASPEAPEASAGP